MPTTREENLPDATQVVAALDLGVIIGAVVDLKPGDMNPVWSVETTSGRWVVKTQQPRGPWWHQTVSASAELEHAARATGVPLAATAPAAGGEQIGMWQNVGGDRYARAIEYLPGVPAHTPLTVEVAGWAGWCLAAVERTAIAADPADAISPVHPLPEWDDWLAQARTLGVLNEPQAAQLRAVAAELAPVVAGGQEAIQHAQLLHHDVTGVNIRITAHGPVLLDFDSAKANMPWWEVVGHALNLATADLGRTEPDRAALDTILATYVSAGGTPGAADETAFTGMLAQRLHFAAFLLWLACGHRDGSVEQRAKAGFDLVGAVETLPVIASNISTWADWLG